MFSKNPRNRVEERITKLLLRKQQFEGFHNEFVASFESSKANKEFQNFRLFYHNKIREVEEI